MTSVIDRPVEDEPTARRARLWRRAAIIAGCVLLVAAVCVGIGFWRYAAGYSPLREGPVTGPYPDGARSYGLRTTDLGDEIFVRGPAGTEVGTTFEIENDGRFDVTIDRIATSDVMRRVEWSPYVVGPRDLGTGRKLPLQPFPAVVKAHQSIRVVATLRKPVCIRGLSLTFSTVGVQWHALGVHHESDLPFAGGATFQGCPTHVT